MKIVRAITSSREMHLMQHVLRRSLSLMTFPSLAPLPRKGNDGMNQSTNMKSQLQQIRHFPRMRDQLPTRKDSSSSRYGDDYDSDLEDYKEHFGGKVSEKEYQMAQNDDDDIDFDDDDEEEIEEINESDLDSDSDSGGELNEDMISGAVPVRYLDSQKNQMGKQRKYKWKAPKRLKWQERLPYHTYLEHDGYTAPYLKEVEYWKRSIEAKDIMVDNIEISRPEYRTKTIRIDLFYPPDYVTEFNKKKYIEWLGPRKTWAEFRGYSQEYQAPKNEEDSDDEDYSDDDDRSRYQEEDDPYAEESEVEQVEGSDNEEYDGPFYDEKGNELEYGSDGEFYDPDGNPVNPERVRRVVEKGERSDNDEKEDKGEGKLEESENKDKKVN